MGKGGVRVRVGLRMVWVSDEWRLRRMLECCSRGVVVVGSCCRWVQGCEVVRWEGVQQVVGGRGQRLRVGGREVREHVGGRALRVGQGHSLAQTQPRTQLATPTSPQPTISARITGWTLSGRGEGRGGGGGGCQGLPHHPQCSGAAAGAGDGGGEAVQQAPISS